MADTPIDTLIIDIEAKASNADKAIDKFANAIGNLANSLSRVDTGKLNSIGNGIQRLSSSLQTMKSIDTRSINSVVNKINSLSAIDASKFATVSANLHQMANGIQSLGTVSANVASVGELAKNISKLGNKSVQTAITNIPQLATSLNGLMTTLSEAPKVSRNLIDMTNALANLTAQGSKVGSASNSIVKGLNRTSNSATKANKSFKGLASAFGRFYANCFLVIRGVKSLWNSINSTADYLEAFNYFEVALNKVGGDWASDYEKYGYENAESYANSFKTRLNESLSGLSGVQISIDANGKTGLLADTGMKNLGLNIQEVTQYASQLASVTNSVGQTGEVTLATASAFTKLGADMSSLFNVDYKSVMNNLQSGLIGQSRALYKYGIDITNATLQTYAYELGVEKAVSEMTQAEKMQLRMIAILDQSKVAWGDQANTINSLSNSIRQFKNNISEAGQILGQLFVPILSKVMPIVNGLVIAIKRLMVSVAGIMGIKLDLSEFGQGTSDITDDMDGLGDSLDEIAESAKKAKAGLRGFDELNVISTSSNSGNDTSASVGGIDLTDDILKATEEYEKAWKEAYDRMQNKAEAFADKIEKALEPVKKIFKDFAVGDFFQAGQDVSNLVVSITDFFARAIDNVDWYGIGKKVGEFFAGIDWFSILKSVGNLIVEALFASVNIFSGIFDGLTGANIGEVYVTSNIDKLKTSMSELSDVAIPKLKEELMRLYEIVYPLNEFAKTVVTDVLDGLLKPSLSYLSETVLPIVRDAFTGTADSVREFGGLVADVAATKIKILYDKLSILWKNVVIPLANAVGGVLSTALKEVAYMFENGVKPRVDAVIKVFQFLWNYVFEPITNFLWDIFEPAFETVFAIVGNKISELGKRFEGLITFISGVFTGDLNHALEGVKQIFVSKFTFIKDTITDIWQGVLKMFNKGGKIFDGVVDGISNTFKSIVNGMITGINNVIAKPFNEINALLNGIKNVSVIGIKPFDGLWANNPLQVPKIPTFANGGVVPEDGWFRASKGEYFGQFDDGTSYIANNKQITDGISSSVNQGNQELVNLMSQEITEIRRQNEILTQILAKEYGISQNDIGRAAQSYAKDYFKRTGREAYSF